ncbi:OCIA domain-containing protein 1 isoform X1 [Python bivittatus]|uniref:OCIA domain-containing protein 1 n=2 Tax=Python bivittatus TaxID=176946 RepID=A0A9F2RF99_PYTBI|nr:OCIA domain-containing protein 1 isoform X1 [Python bivittatus]
MESPGQPRGPGSHGPIDGITGKYKLDKSYELTAEEYRVSQECMRESFLYRCLPFSSFAIALTHILIRKGIITPHPKFGAVPKMAFAGICGWFAGKISYINVCKEKFMNLEDSPLGEIMKNELQLRKQHSEPSRRPSSPERAPATDVPESPSFYETIPFSSSMNESAPSGITDSIPQEPERVEEAPKKKRITYEELRSRNREGYEAGVMQKSASPAAPAPVKEKAKVNKYGDVWEE